MSRGLVPGRVVIEHRGFYRVATETHDELLCQIQGKMRHRAQRREHYPAVGDWVLVEMHSHSGIIREILPRKSKFSRRAAGDRPDEQIVAANIDIVWIVTALDHDFKPRRIERYLALARESGAEPRIVLSKADISPDVESDLELLMATAGEVPVVPVSVRSGIGLDRLREDLRDAVTIALLGSSGVGKSTLINHLAGREILRTNEVREKDSRGRHTTTHRQLVRLADGGIVVDTPGMREIQLWQAEEGVEQTFDEIEQRIEHCRFTDCRHVTEPGCAVLEAVQSGEIEEERYEAFLALRRESEHLLRETDLRAQLEKKGNDKGTQRALRAHLKTKR